MLTSDIIKQHLVVDHDEDDQIINAYWDAAVDYCEGLISGPITQMQRTAYFTSLAIPLVLGPRVISVSAVIYTDEAGAELTLDQSRYTLQYGATGWEIRSVGSWPVSYGTVTVTYTAGFDFIPPAIEQAILMTIGHLYANREATTPIKLEEVPLAVKSLLMPHARVYL